MHSISVVVQVQPSTCFTQRLPNIERLPQDVLPTETVCGDPVLVVAAFTSSQNVIKGDDEVRKHGRGTMQN